MSGVSDSEDVGTRFNTGLCAGTFPSFGSAVEGVVSKKGFNSEAI